MTARVACAAPRRTLGWLLLSAALLRLVAVLWEPPLHPDEYFQYLEPAWWRLSGNGMAAWEWERGLRSWILPIYNGGWMALWRALGLRGPELGLLMKAHWALVNVSVVWLAHRGGRCLGRSLQRDDAATGHAAGLIAAGLCAAFPLLVRYAAHTLSELPSMLCMLAGLVLTAELQEPPPDAPGGLRKAALAGGLLSLGACIRIVNGPLVLVPALWLLARRRLRHLGVLAAAALVPALLFASVDLLTWGTFGGSFVEYVKFNFLENGAESFGKEPMGWYVRTLVQRAPVALALLCPLAVWGLRATWPYLLSAVWLVSYLSLQAHKEERFIIAFWPLVLIAGAGTLGAWLERMQRADAAWRLPRALTALVILATLLDGLRHDAGAPDFLSADRVAAQSWAGQRRELTGLLVDEPYHSAAGLWFGNAAPQLPYRETLLSNPIVSHVLVPSGSEEERSTLAAGFRVVHRQGDFVVLARARP